MQKIKILITGASGMLGSYLTQQLRLMNYQVIAPSSLEFNLLNITQIKPFILSHQPSHIIHLAAVTDGKFIDANPTIPYQINCMATREIAIACLEINAHLFFASTQSVFGKQNREIYYEFDIPQPCDYYSISKYRAELYIEQIIPQHHTIIRMGRLFGMLNCAKPKFFQNMYQLLLTNPPSIEVVSDEYESISSSSHVLQIIQSEIIHHKYPIIHATSMGKVSRFEMIDLMAKICNFSTQIKPMRLSDIRKQNNITNAICVIGSLINEPDFAPKNWREDLNDYYQNINNYI